MTTDDTSVIKHIRRRVNGKAKPKTQRAASWGLTAIEALAGPINFDMLYERTDASTKRKLFTIAATQQLRDYVQQQRTTVRGRAALTEEELIAAIQAWVPSIRKRGHGAVSKAAKLVATMSAEERAELARILKVDDTHYGPLV